jgi:hypothetical protein
MSGRMRRLTGIPRQRLATHGDFAESARISQGIKALQRSGRSWARMSDAQKETLEMDAFKTARIVSGDPNHPDHWEDKGGYAQIGRLACNRKRRARR